MNLNVYRAVALLLFHDKKLLSGHVLLRQIKSETN